MKAARFLAIALAAGLSAGTSAQTAPVQLPANSLVIFGSRYCAPCVAELRELPRISEWRGSRPMIVAWIDKEPAPQIGAYSATRTVEWREARRMLAASSGKSLAVPLVIATDANGRICGSTREALSRSGVNALVRRCG